MKLKKKAQPNHPITKIPFKVNLVDLDPREELEDDNLTSVAELKKVQIGAGNFQVTQIGLGLNHKDETNMVQDQLINRRQTS